MPTSSVCVYCGSSNSVPQNYKDLAQRVGVEMVKRKQRLIYGGGHVGLMGILADSVMQNGGEVIGIIPEHIRAHEVQHNGLTELHVVPDMHTRKRMMAERADAFVILPGGLGTLDEAFEIITWKKLRLHNKPIIVVNYNHYWDPLVALIEATIKESFSQQSDRVLYKVVTTAEEMFTELDSGVSPEMPTLSGRM